MKENIQYASLREVFFFCNAVTSSSEVCNDLTGQLSTWLVGFWKLLLVHLLCDLLQSCYFSSSALCICSFLMFLHRQTKQILSFFFVFFVFVLEKWGITSWPCCWMKNTRMMSKHHHLRLNWLPWKIIESFSCHCTSL